MDGSCSRMTSLLTRCGTPKDSLQRTATSTLVPLERRKGFVTDFLGVGGLGMWMAPGVYGSPEPEEYVKIEPDQLAPNDGAYRVQAIENLEEAFAVLMR